MQARDQRSVFAVPRDGITYLGTTDTVFDTPALHPEVTARRRRLPARGGEPHLRAARRSRARDVRRRLGRAAPAAARGGQVAVGDLAQGRDHDRRRERPDLDRGRQAHHLPPHGGARRRPRVRAPRTARRRRAAPTSVPLPGGEPTGARRRRARRDGCRSCRRSSARSPRPAATARAASGILARVAAIPPPARSSPGCPSVLRAEIEHALDEEMALTLEDLLERRTRVAAVRSPAGARRRRGGRRDRGRAGSAGTPTRTAAEIDGYRRLAASLRSFA